MSLYSPGSAALHDNTLLLLLLLWWTDWTWSSLFLLFCLAKETDEVCEETFDVVSGLCRSFEEFAAESPGELSALFS